MSVSQGVVNFTISLITAGILVGIAWGANASRICALEDNVKAYQSDHDVLIAISTKLDIVQRDIKEIKLDLKTHLQK